MDTFGVVILAAGRGERLGMGEPKPLVPLMGRRLVDFTLRPLLGFLQQRKGVLTVIVGHGREQVERHIREGYPPGIRFAHQREPRGTGDAVKSYFQSNADAKACTYTVLACADTPLLDEEIFSTLSEHVLGKGLSGAVATFHADNPTGYGRIVREAKGFRIVEEADCSEEMRAITEVNSGVYVVETQYLLSRLGEIGRSDVTKEFYLTDIVSDNAQFEVREFDGPERFVGVNTLGQLESVEGFLRRRKIHQLRERGVRFMDSRHVYVEDSVDIGQGCCIYPHVHIMGETVVGKDCILENGAIVRDSSLADAAVIKAYSYIEGARIGEACQIGPFAHLRKGSDIAREAKIGNFVEIKNSQVGKNVGISHLSYVGDAQVGEMTNIGCGFITCNYDGEKKHQTKIGKNNFIGSDSQMIAPVSTGDNCYIASGSTINRDMPAGSFASSRNRQEIREGWAKRFFKGKWSLGKAKKREH